MAVMAQRNWRWCSKCQGLWFAGASANPTGKCPAGGGHTHGGSGDYALFGDPDGNFTDCSHADPGYGGDFAVPPPLVQPGLHHPR